MMSEKERGVLNGSTFPSLWEVISSPEAPTKQVLLMQNKKPYSNLIYNRYRHKVTGAVETSPRPVYGGILADVSLISLEQIGPATYVEFRRWAWERR